VAVAMAHVSSSSYMYPPPHMTHVGGPGAVAVAAATDIAAGGALCINYGEIGNEQAKETYLRKRDLVALLKETYCRGKRDLLWLQQATHFALSGNEHASSSSYADCSRRRTLHYIPIVIISF
jgi:hypothetical protein